jgi:methionyl aminopeptidase
MITAKTPAEIEIMKTGGQRLGKILDQLLLMSKPGIALTEIEKKAKELITEAGGTPSFMTVGDYKWATCLCINDEVVHGIPSERKLVNGDLFTIDVGMIYQGLHTDTAQSIVVADAGHKLSESTVRFLQTGKKALKNAIAQAKSGNRVGDISKAIQDTLEPAGYGVVKLLVGHGVGKTLHEEPQIPGFLKTDISRTPQLKDGVTIAIEIIYAQGDGSVVYANDDGWTISTKDGSLSAVFEHSIAISGDNPIILTLRPSES